jgi:hypothetical protein
MMSDDIPEWAIGEAVDRLNAAYTECYDMEAWRVAADSNHPTVLTVARLIAKHEQPPIDPLLVMAREAAASHYDRIGAVKRQGPIREGRDDQCGSVQSALTALRMAQEQGLPS